MGRQQRDITKPALGALALALLLAAGCRGTPTHEERQARLQVQAVSADYRPAGQRPALPALDTNSGLGDFLRFALLHQPKVEVAYYDWLASVERITVARSLPDPQLTFQMDIQDVVTSIMPGLMMNFPGPGKLRAAAAVASAESQARYFAFETSALESAYDVKRAYYQLHFLEAKTRVNQENLNLVTDLEKLARAQNEVGKVTLQDVLRAQIEQDRLRAEIVNLEDSRSALRARFKAALGLRAEDPAPPVPQRFESTSLDLSSEDLWATALARSPRLKALEAEVRTAEAAITLASKARLPDASLGLMADVKMSPTLYRPLGTVTIPLWRDKLAAQVAEARANQRAAQARLSAEEIALALDFAEQSFVCREAGRNLELLQHQLLPKALQSLVVARSGYLAGQTDFLNVIDSERTLLGFQLDRVEADTQRELALAELSLIVQGVPSPNAPMRPSAATTPPGRPSPANRVNPAGMNRMR